MAEQPYNPVERTEQHSRTLENLMACGHNPPFSVIRRLIDYTREVNDLVTTMQVWCERWSAHGHRLLEAITATNDENARLREQNARLTKENCKLTIENLNLRGIETVDV